MTDKVPAKEWLEQVQHYEQPFTVVKGDDVFMVTVKKVDE